MIRETGVQSWVESYQRFKKVLDTAILSTQHNKVRIKSKVVQFGNGIPPSSTPQCSSY